jgi:hypothetical protein
VAIVASTWRLVVRSESEPHAALDAALSQDLRMDALLQTGGRSLGRLYARDPLAPEEKKGKKKKSKSEGVVDFAKDLVSSKVAPFLDPVAALSGEAPTEIISRQFNRSLGGLEMAANLIDTPGAMARNTLTLVPGGVEAHNPLNPLMSPLSSEGRTYGEDVLIAKGLISKERPDGFFANVPRFTAGLAYDIATDPLTYTGLGLFGRGLGGLSKVGRAIQRAGLLDKSVDVAKAAAKEAGQDPSRVGWRLSRQKTTPRDILEAGQKEGIGTELPRSAGMGNDAPGGMFEGQYMDRMRAAGMTDDMLDTPLGGLATFGPTKKRSVVFDGTIPDPLGGKTRGMVRDVLGRVPGGQRVVEGFRNVTSAADKVPGALFSGQEAAAVLDRTGEAIRYSLPVREAARVFSPETRQTSTKTGQEYAGQLDRKDAEVEFEARSRSYNVIRGLDEAFKGTPEENFELSKEMFRYLEASKKELDEFNDGTRAIPDAIKPYKELLDEYRMVNEETITRQIEAGSGIQRLGTREFGKAVRELEEEMTAAGASKDAIDEATKKLADEQMGYLARVRNAPDGTPMRRVMDGKAFKIADPHEIGRDPVYAAHGTDVLNDMSVDPDFAGVYDKNFTQPKLPKNLSEDARKALLESRKYVPDRKEKLEAFRAKYADRLDENPKVQEALFDRISKLDRNQVDAKIPMFNINPGEGLQRRTSSGFRNAAALETATDMLAKNASRIGGDFQRPPLDAAGPTPPPVGPTPPPSGLGPDPVTPPPTAVDPVTPPPGVVDEVVPPTADPMEAMRSNRVKAEGVVRLEGRGGLALDFEPYRQFDEAMRDISYEANQRWTFHGIRDLHGNPPEASLDSLLTKGVDKSRAFFTGPARIVDGTAGAGLNTKTNAPYLLMFDGVKKALKGKPDYVVVNDGARVNMDTLRSMYPKVKFIDPVEARQIAEASVAKTPPTSQVTPTTGTPAWTEAETGKPFRATGYRFGKARASAETGEFLSEAPDATYSDRGKAKAKDVVLENPFVFDGFVPQEDLLAKFASEGDSTASAILELKGTPPFMKVADSHIRKVLMSRGHDGAVYRGDPLQGANEVVVFGKAKAEGVVPSVGSAEKEPWQMTAFEYAVQHSRRMTELQKLKPRPLSKLFGKKGPTKEQAASHAEEMKAWNREYRAASKSHKAHLEDQGAHRREVESALREGKPVTDEVLNDYPHLKPNTAPTSKAADAAKVTTQAADQENFWGLGDALKRSQMDYIEARDDRAFRNSGASYPTFVSPDGVRIAIQTSNDILFNPNSKDVLYSSSRPEKGVVILDAIVTPEGSRGQGLASKALKSLVRAADESGVTLKAEVAPMSQQGKQGALSKKGLIDWYKRHGFETESKGSQSPILVRKPKATAPASKAKTPPKTRTKDPLDVTPPVVRLSARERANQLQGRVEPPTQAATTPAEIRQPDVMQQPSVVADSPRPRTTSTATTAARVVSSQEFDAISPKHSTANQTWTKAVDDGLLQEEHATILRAIFADSDLRSYPSEARFKTDLQYRSPDGSLNRADGLAYPVSRSISVNPNAKSVIHTFMHESGHIAYRMARDGDLGPNGAELASKFDGLVKSNPKLLDELGIIDQKRHAHYISNTDELFAEIFARSHMRRRLRGTEIGRLVAEVEAWLVDKLNILRKFAGFDPSVRSQIDEIMDELGGFKKGGQSMPLPPGASLPRMGGDDVRPMPMEGPRAAAPPQTETPEFKNWFGGSRVVDADGRPLVVYHGTAASFDAFDTTKGKTEGSAFGPGSYFTPVAANAWNKKGSGDGQRVLPVYLKMEKPLDSSVPMSEETARMVSQYIGREVKEGDMIPLLSMERKGGTTTEAAKAAGFDGVIHWIERGGKAEKNYIAIHPNQIKSATGNRGTFDPNDADIRAMPMEGPDRVVPPLVPATETNLYSAISAFKEGGNENFMRAVIQKIGPVADQIREDIIYMSGKDDYVPTNKEILEFLKMDRAVAEDLLQIMAKPQGTGGEQFWLRLADAYLNSMKTLVTAVWPGFHSRNRFGGIVQNVLMDAFDPTVTGPTAPFMKYRQPDIDWKALDRGEVVQRAAEIPALRNRWINDQLMQMRQPGKLEPGTPNPTINDVDMSKYTDKVATEELRKSVFASGITDSPGATNDLVGQTGGRSASQIPGLEAMQEAKRDPATLSDFEKRLSPAKRVFFRSVMPPKGARWRDILNPLATRGVMADDDLFAPARAGRALGNVVEGRNRGTAFIAYLRQGYDEVEALRKVKEIHLDYSKLSTREKNTMRRIIPFYAFQRRMIPMLANELGNRPGGPMAQTIRSTNRLRDPNEVTPGYISDTVSLPLGRSNDGGRRYLTGFGLMHEAPLQMVSTSPFDFARKVMSQTAPLVKAFPEMGANELYFQGGPEGGRSLNEADPPLGRLISNVTGDPNPKRLGNEIEYLVGMSPFSRAITTMRQLSDPRKTMFDKGVNLLTGARIATVSPATEDSVLREDAESILKSLGARNFTRSYIPENVKATMTPEELQKLEQANARLNLLDKRQKERSRAKKEAENELKLRGEG